MNITRQATTTNLSADEAMRRYAGGDDEAFAELYAAVTPRLGPDYWGASGGWPSSPVVPGANTVLLAEVQSPEPTPVPLDGSQVEGVLSFVPASEAAAIPFEYCIRNVKMVLR